MHVLQYNLCLMYTIFNSLCNAGIPRLSYGYLQSLLSSKGLGVKHVFIACLKGLWKHQIRNSQWCYGDAIFLLSLVYEVIQMLLVEYISELFMLVHGSKYSLVQLFGHRRSCYSKLMIFVIFIVGQRLCGWMVSRK